MAFSSDGTRITSAWTDETLKVWDASSGACLQTLEIHDGWAIPMVLFSDAGRTYIFSLSENTNSIKIWDASSGVCVQTLEVFGQPLALSSNGPYVASTSDDKTIKIWDANSGACLQTLEGQRQSVKFDTTSSCFYTETGIPPWNGTLNTQKVADTNICGTPQHRTYALNHDWTWITRNGQKMLWLPPEYRPTPFEFEYRLQDSSGSHHFKRYGHWMRIRPGPGIQILWPGTSITITAFQVILCLCLHF